LHHVQITLSKRAEEESKRFYCNILGLPEVENLNLLKGEEEFG